jgi:aldose 1-epimerase
MVKIVSGLFGETSKGLPVELYTFTNDRGCEVSVCSYGASIVAIKVPDRYGNMSDIVLGYEDTSGYISGKNFFGAAIGRCGNRIGKGRFTLNGEKYQLSCNDGNNHLHGGFNGFSTKVWKCAVKKNNYGDYLELCYISHDGDENYPGRLETTLTYSFNDENELSIHYKALSDKDTICNLTNHSYFNLSGHDFGDILEHQLKIYADAFTETDSESIPTGKILDVESTPLDFRNFHVVGDRINSDYYELKYAGGYDHNLILNKGNKILGLCAEMYDKKSGRHMTCITTSPCVQFYSGNYIDGSVKGKNGFTYKKRYGLCLETQFAPDAVNNPEWDSPILKAGDIYDGTTIYKFDVI